MLYSFFFFAFILHVHVVLLLLLLVILLKHHQLLWGELVPTVLIWRQVAREIGSGLVQPVIVLSTEKELFLFISQVSVWVKVRFPQDVDILLELADLSKVPHKSLGHLLYKEGLIGHRHQYSLLLLSIGSLESCISLPSPLEWEHLAPLKFLGRADKCWRALDSLSESVLLEEALDIFLELFLLHLLLAFHVSSALLHICAELRGDGRIFASISRLYWRMTFAE